MNNNATALTWKVVGKSGSKIYSVLVQTSSEEPWHFTIMLPPPSYSERYKINEERCIGQ